MGELLNLLKEQDNFTYTENGAVTHKSTGSALMDMFALGGAMRTRSDEDVILMARKAFNEDPVYAMRCLFYLRDIRGGQGERRFFRTVIRDIALHEPKLMEKYIQLIPEYGRWDDLYCFVDTELQESMLAFIKGQLINDLASTTPSLMAKWLKSENTSSRESQRLGMITRIGLGLTPREYRKILSKLRGRIKIIETLMSQNRWGEIEFDKIPSKAGMVYRNAFARRDITRERYKKFALDENTKVNAGALYPYEVVEKACNMVTPWSNGKCSETERAIINKYWDNLTDYFDGSTLNALAVVDTSGSMYGTPMNVAISIGMYCAERAKGPFANHYISFSRLARLVEVEGIDFVDKVYRIYRTNVCENTNIENVFDLLLNTALDNNLKQEELPENIIIISDMEFDEAVGCGSMFNLTTMKWIEIPRKTTLMEDISAKWARSGYNMPKLIYWNVNARQNNIPIKIENGISFVSGFSPSIFKSIMSGKTAFDLMYEVLNSERYSKIN